KGRPPTEATRFLAKPGLAAWPPAACVARPEWRRSTVIRRAVSSSEMELQRKLDLPPGLARCSGNFAECGRPEEYPGRIKRGGVQEIEELRPKLEKFVLVDRPLLGHRGIPVAQ